MTRMKIVYPIEENCIACHHCEVACAVEHSRSKNPIRAYKDEGWRFLPHARVESRQPESFSIMCRHCTDNPCVEACITGAMYREDPEGPVRVNQEHCIGCWMCIMACPYGVIKRDLRAKAVSSKCDLCPDREIPACVEACPNRALVYEER